MHKLLIFLCDHIEIFIFLVRLIDDRLTNELLWVADMIKKKAVVVDVVFVFVLLQLLTYPYMLYVRCERPARMCVRHWTTLNTLTITHCSRFAISSACIFFYTFVLVISQPQYRRFSTSFCLPCCHSIYASDKLHSHRLELYSSSIHFNCHIHNVTTI